MADKMYLPPRKIKFSLPKERFHDIIKELLESRIPAIPEYIMGLDGTFYEISIENGFNYAHYQWWSKPPEGWEKLEEFVERILVIVRERG